MTKQMIEAVSKAIFDAASKKYSDNATEKWLADTFAQAAIAAVFQEIREAAGRDDVVEAFYQTEVKAGPKGATVQEHVLAMLDQIERTQKP
jgi:hypothetical protein